MEALGVASGTVTFADTGQREPGLFFPYPVGWKARSLLSKSFVSGGGFQSTFWNLQRVLAAAPSTVYITEGELDACALVEAGIAPSQVLSMPNGARLPKQDGQATPAREQRGYAFVDDALKAGLSRTKRFIWCGDTDKAGLALRFDMVQLFGAARFHTVDWPDGAKDANDLLMKMGPQALREAVQQLPVQWPVEGLYTLEQLPEPPQLDLWQPHYPEWERKVMLAPTMLSVVTGHPNHGKSLFFNELWHGIVNKYDLAMAVASFETRPKPHMRRQLRTLHAKRLEKDMTYDEIDEADRWINDHYHFIVHPEERPSLEWFLDTAEVAVIRHGVKIVQADPWNRFEASRRKDETEPEYILRALKAMHVFAKDMNVHMQIVAHPSKMDSARKGQPPMLEDIAGTKHWENVVDQGFVVHRPEMFDGGERKTSMSFYQRKSRFDELGYPCKLNMDYDLKTGRYKCIDYK